MRGLRWHGECYCSRADTNTESTMTKRSKPRSSYDKLAAHATALWLEQKGEGDRLLDAWKEGSSCCDANVSYYDDGTGAWELCCKQCLTPIVVDGTRILHPRHDPSPS